MKVAEEFARNTGEAGIKYFKRKVEVVIENSPKKKEKQQNKKICIMDIEKEDPADIFRELKIAYASFKQNPQFRGLNNIHQTLAKVNHEMNGKNIDTKTLTLVDETMETNASIGHLIALLSWALHGKAIDLMKKIFKENGSEGDVNEFLEENKMGGAGTRRMRTTAFKLLTFLK